MNNTQEVLRRVLGGSIDFSHNPARANVMGNKYLIYAWDITPSKANDDALRLQKNHTVCEFEFQPGHTTLIVGYSKEGYFFGIYEAINYPGILPIAKSFWFRDDALEGLSQNDIVTEDFKGQHVHYLTERGLLEILRRTKRWAKTPGEYTRQKQRIDKGTGKAALNNQQHRTKRASRDRAHTFLYDVKIAYEGRCAILGTKAKKVHAAHIADVASDHGNDSIKNGLLLNDKHHAQFDSGRLIILPDGTYYFNPENSRKVNLRVKRQKLHLPADEKHHPEPKFFIKKLEYLGFEIPDEILEMV